MTTYIIVLQAWVFCFEELSWKLEKGEQFLSEQTSMDKGELDLSVDVVSCSFQTKLLK